MTKRGLVMALVAAGLVASVVAGREKPPAEAVPPAARIDARVRLAEDLDLSGLRRGADAGATTDLFAARSFAAEAQAPAKGGKPGAPPLPFTYIGKMIEDGKLAVFLSRNGESLSVAAGDRVGDYRVDAIGEAEITFTYLPLKTKQRLPL